MPFPECQPESVVEKSTEGMGKEISLIQFHQTCCLAFLELLWDSELSFKGQQCNSANTLEAPVSRVGGYSTLC